MARSELLGVRAALLVLALGIAAGAAGQQAPAADPAVKPAVDPAAKPAAKATKPVVKKQAVKKGPTWAELTPAQQTILAPLQPDWQNLEAERKAKWLGIAKRYPKMKPQQQENVQKNMHAWAALTPEQRRQARENYRKIAKVPPEKRKQEWADYQQLSPAERDRLVYEPVEPPAQKKKKSP